jgi:hypothetical protein
MVELIPKGFIPITDAYAQAVSAIADFNQAVTDGGLPDYNKHDELERDVETKMRTALANRDLPVFQDTPDGPRELVERAEWSERAFGIPTIENTPHALTNPSPNNDGKIFFLRESDFKKWLRNNSPGNRRGAPMQHDWPDAKNYALNLLHDRGGFREWDNGDWKCQADLERDVLNYMERTTGKGPGESTIRAKVKEWLTEWRTKANK